MSSENSKQSLLDFARSLDAVEIFSLSNASNRQLTAKHSTQTFRYIIVIDLEATCWPKETQKWKTHEIIEFPAVLLNLTSGRIESEFRQYVMPLENPRLSEFCTELTGIRQEQVDAGVPLSTCFMLFNKWLKKVLTERNLYLPKTDPRDKTGNVALATWSDWDLGACLSKECTRKRISKPPCFDLWIDVRAIYRQFYQGRPTNFGESLERLGIRFEGRPHSGLDDSRNLARLIVRMCKDGANFVITKDLKPFDVVNKQ
ncbi:3'-5' exonuclease Snipper [Topomyia yanbarensis]|uniref:3'-5' exonuclease Snipper n=1 Tax=Topomyia yanbarensis TaxID=2498891 RepID=UPI00273AA5F4|nr:3'-5' exonuclease Snipper [Topomyia yanbarensis]